LNRVSGLRGGERGLRVRVKRKFKFIRMIGEFQRSKTDLIPISFFVLSIHYFHRGERGLGMRMKRQPFRIRGVEHVALV
jgi:hypothetical protein